MKNKFQRFLQLKEPKRKRNRKKKKGPAPGQPEVGVSGAKDTNGVEIVSSTKEDESADQVIPEAVEPIGTFVPSTPISQGVLVYEEDVNPAEAEASKVLKSWGERVEAHDLLMEKEGEWQTPKRKGSKYKPTQVSPHNTRSRSKGGTVMVPQ
ncbi:hypothetical protein FRX31_006284 [Thalictrum thalictroides]|uniref:Uncharacterized protein n=1 Tax=Thalictrum thalictroides TaxID=46969 RepID=A0A7J6X2Z7_THATH|nr:hypothetical protein FRX31_006284 [Thalictrum thalictroides]